MKHSDDLRKLIKALPFNLKVAFLTACAEKASKIYTEVADEYIDMPEKMVSYAWDIAEGKEVGQEVFNNCLKCAEAVGEIYESGPEARAFLSAFSAFEYAYTKVETLEVTAAIEAIEAISGLVRSENEDYVGKEEAWQIEAIDFASQWKDQKIRRDMFSGITDKDPQWYIDWQNYMNSESNRT